MLRILFRKTYFCFATHSKKYFIKSGAYLLEYQPEKPILAYQKFFEDYTRNIPKQKLNLQFRKAAKAKFQQPGVRDKYENEYKVLQQQYKKKYEFWEANFNIPFKNPTFLAQFAKKIRTQGLLMAQTGQGSYAKKSSELMKLLTPEERLQIQQNVAKIKEQREKIQKKYQFPVKLYDTQRSYDLKHTEPKTKPTEATKKKLQADYENYVKQWKIQVENWLKANNYNLSIDEFVTMYDQVLANKQAKKEANKAKKQQSLKQSPVTNTKVETPTAQSALPNSVQIPQTATQPLSQSIGQTKAPA